MRAQALTERLKRAFNFNTHTSLLHYYYITFIVKSKQFLLNLFDFFVNYVQYVKIARAEEKIGAHALTSLKFYGKIIVLCGLQNE